MAEYLIDKAYLVALADAIRKKSGPSSKMTPSAMVSAINNLGDMTYTPPSSPTVINKTGELYTIQDTTFNSLAKAIRNKAGISDKMTPHKMIDVVNGLNSARAFAVFSADDNSLNFYKRVDVPKVGERFEGKTATEVYVGIEDGDVTPLVSVYAPDIAGAKWPCASYVTEVNVIDPITAPRGLNGYFADFNTAHTMNLAKLDTSNVTNMKDMFSSCSSLTSLDLSCFNTSSVTDMMSMFRNCSELTTLNLYGFDTSSVKGAYLMFYRCYNLKQVTLGDKFTWVGLDGRLPTQNASNIPNADGKWYAASDGKGYAPSEIPSNKADTYYAYPPQAFAVYSADDKSLNFYKRFSVPKAGEQFEGKIVTNVYTGIETTEYNAEDIVCPWESIKPNIKYITAIDKISPRSMCGWFASIEHMHTANIDKIDVSNTMRLDGLFADNFHNSCFRVNIESWNISDICNIDYIFDSLIPADGNGLTCLILGKGNVKIASKLPHIQYGTGRSAFNIRTNKYETYPVIESGSGGEYIFLSQHLMNDGPDKYAWDADFWK